MTNLSSSSNVDVHTPSKMSENETLVIRALKTLKPESVSSEFRDAVYGISEDIANYEYSNRVVIGSPETVTSMLMAKYRNANNETFGIVYLDTKLAVISIEEIITGTIDGCAVYPRNVLEKVLASGATHCICYHNHPSGNPTPSSSDFRITERLQDVLKLIDVDMKDHIILGKFQTYSFAEHGKI